MRLNNESLKENAFWDKAGITLPRFDRGAMIAATAATPQWLHFGAGNIFRAFPAALAQSLLEQGLSKTGVVVADRYDQATITQCFSPIDNFSLLVTLKSDGSTDKKIIASVASVLAMSESFEELKKIFAAPSLQMVSFTITEKGYNVNGQNDLLPDVAEDIKNGPGASKSYMGRIAALCHERFVRGALPLAMVSMDNCSHNGDRLFSAVETFARGWTENGSAAADFLDYVRNRQKLSFPWSMIDKITPGPDAGVRDTLVALGLEEMGSRTPGNNIFIAPFVNAEETQYLVIEDTFPNGRPTLEKTGVLFTDRETVDKVEKMKVCTCLNPLHTALAIFGCLLGYKRISDEMKDQDLVKLIEGIGYREGLPVVINPGIIDPEKFIGEVIKVRLPNPFMPDTPQRIAADTSQKIPVRFGETLKAYKSAGKNLKELKLIPLIFAGWLRYLLGIDDQGKPFELSPDPLYENLAPSLSGITVGADRLLGKPDHAAIHSKLESILSNPDLFGLNLYETGLGKQVEDHFAEMIAGAGAVRKVLSRMVG
jgi:fructuronate reductase